MYSDHSTVNSLLRQKHFNRPIMSGIMLIVAIHHELLLRKGTRKLIRGF